MDGEAARHFSFRRAITGIAALALATWPAIASAETSPILLFDGYALEEACADGAVYYTYGKCAGYIIAAHDAYVLWRGIDAEVCFSLDNGITTDALIAPVVGYLENHSRQLFEPASTLVVSSLKNAFPCIK